MMAILRLHPEHYTIIQSCDIKSLFSFIKYAKLLYIYNWYILYLYNFVSDNLLSIEIYDPELMQVMLWIINIHEGSQLLKKFCVLFAIK